MGGSGGVIVYEKLTFTSEYVTAMPGQSLLANSSVDKASNNSCRHGAPGTIYGSDLDVLSVNKEGTLTTKPIYLYGNSARQFGIRTLDLKGNAKVVFYNTA